MHMTLDVLNRITVKVSYKKFLFKKNIILSEGTYYKTKYGIIKLEVILLNENNILELMISYTGEDFMPVQEWVVLDEFMILFGILPGEYSHTVDKNYILRTADYSSRADISIYFKINDYVTYTVTDNKGYIIFYGNGQIQDMWNINNSVSACIIGGVEFHFTSTGLMIDNSSPVISKYDDERTLKIRKIEELVH